MSRLVRVVAGLSHHITQRGNRRQQTFCCDEVYLSYLDLMGQPTPEDTFMMRKYTELSDWARKYAKAKCEAIGIQR